MHSIFLSCVAAALLLACPAVAREQPQGSADAPFRVAVAGLSHGHVDGFFGHYLKRPDVQVVGIYEEDAGVAERAAARMKPDKALMYADLDEMLAKSLPHAVIVCTSTADHRAVIEKCAARGVHVMVEKPLAIGMEDARAIEKAAKAGNIHLLVNYETTWYRSGRAAYDLVKSGALGEVRKIVAHHGHNGPKEIGCGTDFLAWLTDPKENGSGALHDFGCYGADLATWIMQGERPTSVMAVTQRMKPHMYPHVDDEATIVVTYPKAQLIIQASWNWPFSRKDIEVYGERGSVVTVADGAVRVRRPGENAEKQVEARAIDAPENDPITYFRAVVLDGLKPWGPSSLDTNITVMEILGAASESAMTGKRVPLELAR